LESFGKRVSSGGQSISIIPSVIHYGETSQNLDWPAGDGSRPVFVSIHAALDETLHQHAQPVEILRAGQEITPSIAGQDFVGNAVGGLPSRNWGFKTRKLLSLCLSNAYEHYEDWLSRIFISNRRAALSPDRRNPRLPLLAMESTFSPGAASHLDFGGGTMDVSVSDRRRSDPSGWPPLSVIRKFWPGGGRLDAGSMDLPGSPQRWGLGANSAAAAAISNALLVPDEQPKKHLLKQPRPPSLFQNPESHADLEWHLSREDFESILEEHELFTSIHQTIRHALNAAYERGFYRRPNILKSCSSGELTDTGGQSHPQAYVR
jgi:hypothetical protein